jgi:hypothetical protein
MDPLIWGPGAWLFIHSITLNYPERPSIEHQTNMKNFIFSLTYLLPCEVCKYNYSKKIKKLNINNIVKNKSNLIKMFIDIHNEVNVQTNKKKLTQQEAINEITKQYEKKNDSTQCTTILCVSMIFFVITIILMNKK